MGDKEIRVRTLFLDGFRNYEAFEIRLSPGLTIIVGPNAKGKTNAIEALQLMTSTESFRNPTWKDLIGWEKDEASVRLVTDSSTRETTVSMSLDRLSGRREYRVGGTKKKVSDIRGMFPSVVFTPEDLVLCKGSADSRRRALDLLGDQLSATYAALRQEYASVLRSRNTLLKERGDSALLGVLTEQVSSLGVRFMRHRERLAGRIKPRIETIYRELSCGEDLSFDYRRSWEADNVDMDDTDAAVSRFLEDSLSLLDEDTRRGTTSIGPHRDDVRILCEERDTRTFASQGQQRTVALAWKLAEVEVIEEISGKTPLLLLDDVMSELDASRRRALLEVATGKTQTVLTTTNLDYFDEDVLSASAIQVIP